MKKEKVWIYIDYLNQPTKKPVWLHVKKEDDRFDWGYPPTPPGMVKYIYRRGTKPKWSYVNYGDTQQEVCDKYNEHNLERIAKLKAQLTDEIAYIEKHLLHPPKE